MIVAFILPTYNERDDIISLLDELQKITKKLIKYDFFYVVVDDESPDGTGKLVKEYKKNNPKIHLLSGKKEGLGKALIKGMEYATVKLNADLFFQMDADHSHNPLKIPEFFQKYEKGFDFVVGSRYIPGGSIPENWGLHRKIFSVVGNAIVRYGLGFAKIHDWTGGYRLHDKKFFISMKESLNQFSGYVFQIAFLHKAVQLGAKVGEVPIAFTDRKYGRSKIAPAEYIKNVLKYVFTSRFKSIAKGSAGKFLIVGAIGFIINTVALEVFIKFFHFHPASASAFGAELAIISNFFLNNFWTFKSRKASGLNLVPKFFQFNLSSLGALVIQFLSVSVGTYFFGKEDYRIFYILGVLIGLIWNYTMYSKVIWKNK